MHSKWVHYYSHTFDIGNFKIRPIGQIRSIDRISVTVFINLHAENHEENMDIPFNISYKRNISNGPFYKKIFIMHDVSLKANRAVLVLDSVDFQKSGKNQNQNTTCQIRKNSPKDPE